MKQYRAECTLSSPLPSPLPHQKAAGPDIHSQWRLAERGSPDNSPGTQWPGAQSFTETLINRMFIHSFLPSFHSVAKCLQSPPRTGQPGRRDTVVPEMDSGPVRSPAQCSLVRGQARPGAVIVLGTWTVMKETMTGA